MVEREAGSIWHYYSLTRVHLLIPDAMAPPPKDYLNKAVALFRFWLAYRLTLSRQQRDSNVTTV